MGGGGKPLGGLGGPFSLLIGGYNQQTLTVNLYITLVLTRGGGPLAKRLEGTMIPSDGGIGGGGNALGGLGNTFESRIGYIMQKIE